MNSSPNSALDASVLVLNKLFMAIHIISVRRAFCLLFKDLAEVVSLEDGTFATYDFATWREVSEFRARNFRQEDDDWVRTVHSEIQAPRVIRLTGFDRMPSRRSSSTGGTFSPATTTSASTAARSSRPAS